LKARDPVARARAAAAIARMGPNGKDAVPSLTVAIKDPELSVRAAAAYALGQIGAAAAPALPNLEAASNTPSLRDVARKAIDQIGAAPVQH
jgi:HEAT repeat protein